jgi:hypothetical protein
MKLGKVFEEALLAEQFANDVVELDQPIQKEARQIIAKEIPAII